MPEQLSPVPAPQLTIEQVAERRELMIAFIQRAMEAGKDYGLIPGTDKPTLLKPGAEKLLQLFSLTYDFELLDRVLDWERGLFYFHYRVNLYRGGAKVGDGEGSCCSWESKYRYRQAERRCPQCGQSAIIKGRAEYGGGWLCFAKKGGCGAKFRAGDQAIEGQSVGRVANPDPADQLNTIKKMARKRALIDGALWVTGGSMYFTQDIEDFADLVIEGSYEPLAPLAGAEQPGAEGGPAAAEHGRLLERIEQLWADEQRLIDQLAGRDAAQRALLLRAQQQEQQRDLERLPTDQLVSLGKAIRRRVEGLQARTPDADAAAGL